MRHGSGRNSQGGTGCPADARESGTRPRVRNSTLRDYIGSIKSKHTLLIADACFSVPSSNHAVLLPCIFGLKKYMSSEPEGQDQRLASEVPTEAFSGYLSRRLADMINPTWPPRMILQHENCGFQQQSHHPPIFGRSLIPAMRVEILFLSEKIECRTRDKG